MVHFKKDKLSHLLFEIKLFARERKGLFTVLVLLVLAGGTLGVMNLRTWAAPLTYTINYQGRLLHTTNGPVDTCTTMTFTIYDTLSGAGTTTAAPYPIQGTCGAGQVDVNNGLFSVLLTPADPAIFENDTEYYLEVNVAGTPMTPRKQLALSPRAFWAKTAGFLGTRSETQFIFNQTGTMQAANYSIDGSAGIGVATPGAKLDIAIAGVGKALQIVSTGTGAAAEPVISLDILGANKKGMYLKMGASTNDYGMHIDGANTGNTGALLFVENVGSGSVAHFKGTDASTDVPAVIIEGNGNQNILEVRSEVAGTSQLTVDQDGKVGIGTASPTAYLHIKAGTATANTAPIKFTAGINLLTPEEGAMEFDGNNLYITTSTPTRKQLLTLADATALTVGSVIFSGASGNLAEDNANFYFDDTNNTFGLGTTRTGAISGTNPSFRIKGTGATSGTSSFEVQDSAGATKFFVRDDGNVGIGEPIPTAKLHVTGSAGIVYEGSNGFVSAAFVDGGSSDQGTLRLYTGGVVNNQISSDPSSYTYFNAGNVGIGTKAPTGALSVTPLQYSTGTASQLGNTITGSGTTFTVAMVGSQFVFANGTSAGTITAFGGVGTLTVSISQTVSPAQNYNILYTGLQVASTGNVGIGTDSPTTRLSIHDSSVAGEPAVKITNVNNASGFSVGVHVTGKALIQNLASTDMLFYTSGIARFVISSGGGLCTISGGSPLTCSGINGSVGIKTSTPGTALQVSGGLCVSSATTACTDPGSGGITKQSVNVPNIRYGAFGGCNSGCASGNSIGDLCFSTNGGTGSKLCVWSGSAWVPDN